MSIDEDSACVSEIFDVDVVLLDGGVFFFYLDDWYWSDNALGILTFLFLEWSRWIGSRVVGCEGKDEEAGWREDIFYKVWVASEDVREGSISIVVEEVVWSWTEDTSLMGSVLTILEIREFKFCVFSRWLFLIFVLEAWLSSEK